MRIAMWSGPRNLSTAMMYAFAARGDCAALDEPFYAAYLAASGADHPMRAEVLAAQDTDPAAVAALCAGPIPGGQPHLYMKHMAHHMLPDFPLGWAEECVNVHLIRHPARVIASYTEKRAEVTAEDLGYHRHLEVFGRLPGPVIDSDAIRRDPEGMLARLCAEIGLPFTPSMLHWEAGPKPFDGAWAPHWYNAVHASTGLVASDPGPLPDMAGAVLEAVLPEYEELAQHTLTGA